MVETRRSFFWSGFTGFCPAHESTGRAFAGGVAHPGRGHAHGFLVGVGGDSICRDSHVAARALPFAWGLWHRKCHGTFCKSGDFFIFRRHAHCTGNGAVPPPHSAGPLPASGCRHPAILHHCGVPPRLCAAFHVDQQYGCSPHDASHCFIHHRTLSRGIRKKLPSRLGSIRCLWM